MTGAMLLLLQAAAVAATPPVDWAALPDYPWRRSPILAEGSAFVRGEIAAGRCQAPAADPRMRLAAPVALLVGAGGRVVRVVPRAIGCAAVEQFTAGYVLSMTRGDGAPVAPGWYRLAVGYGW